MSQKSVAAIHDISGFGRCSLTIALPILSAMGVKTSVIPTAVLSTHTGGFKGNTFHDLTSDIEPIAKELILIKSGNIMDRDTVEHLCHKYGKAKDLEEVYMEIFGGEEDHASTGIL